MDPHATLTVRPARRDELQPLGELAAALVRFHHAIDPLRFLLVDDVARGYARWFGKELDNPDALLLVAVDGEGPPLGYAYGRLEARDWNLLLDRHAALHDILVTDDARGRGVGHRLLDAFCDAMKSRGAPRVVLHTATSNTTAQALFRAKGFRTTMLEMTLEL
jgi:ribosomal protein S18 acetylase RimI-like enzyme